MSGFNLDVWYDRDTRVEARVGDTQAAIDDDPMLVKVYRGRTMQTIDYKDPETGEDAEWIKCRLSLKQNIPNFATTASSQGRFNDATFIFLPDVPVQAGDRVVTDNGVAFYCIFVNPEQTWHTEAMVIHYGGTTVPS